MKSVLREVKISMSGGEGSGKKRRPRSLRGSNKANLDQHGSQLYLGLMGVLEHQVIKLTLQSNYFNFTSLNLNSPNN